MNSGKSPSSFYIKRLLPAFLLLYALITLAPAAIYFHSPAGTARPTASPTPSASPGATPSGTVAPPDFLSGQSVPNEPTKPTNAHTQFTLIDRSTGETLQVSERDFLRASIACEMDLAAPEEALKAQAVAAYSYYSRLRDDGQAIICDCENWLVYVPDSAMQARWGEDYASYSALLDRIVDAVPGQRLTYGGQTALCCYFAISPGSTEDSRNVWGDLSASPDESGNSRNEHPYLQAVASPGDMFSDGYLSYASFTADELADAVSAYDFGDAAPYLSGPAEDWLSDTEYTPSGMVRTISLGGATVSGTQVREALGLRSAGFSWEYTEGGFQFTIHGWGHGVGMSQAGAVFMAKRGADYREILAHYYPGTVLEG